MDFPLCPRSSLSFDFVLTFEKPSPSLHSGLWKEQPTTTASIPFWFPVGNVAPGQDREPHVGWSKPKADMLLILGLQPPQGLQPPRGLDKLRH